MKPISNPPVDTLEEISYWKQKNGALIKELVEYKSLQNELKQNMDYLSKEKFLSDQKIERIERVFSILNKRTRSCLDKVVECSTDLTDILRVLSEVQKMKDSLKVFGIGSLTDSVNETSSNPIQVVGNLEKSEAEENTSLNELTFVSRGGKTVPIENGLGLPQSDMESEIDNADDEEEQDIEFAGRLSTIPEDFEQSSIINEESQGQPGFASSVSKNTTKFNLEEKEEAHSDNEDNDMSTQVEASTTIMDSSILNNTNPQGNITAVTPKLSFSRKSIGIPRPSSEGNTGLSQHISARKSIGSPRPRSEGRPNILSEYISSQRSSQFSPDISNIKRRTSPQTTNSPWSPSENVALRRLKKVYKEMSQQKPMTPSVLGNTTQDISCLADYLKNTSTPILLENISRIPSNTVMRRQNVGDKKSEYVHKKRRKFETDYPDDDRSIEQENISNSETKNPHPNETSLRCSKKKDIDNTSIATKSLEVFQSDTKLKQAFKTCTEESPVDSHNSSPKYSRRKKYPPTSSERRYVESDAELEEATNTDREESPGDSSNSSPKYSRRKKRPPVRSGRRYVESDAELEEASNTDREESPGDSSNSSPKYSRRKKRPPVRSERRYVDSPVNTERDYKKRYNFNSNAKVDEASDDQQNKENNPYPNDGSLGRSNKKRNNRATKTSNGPKTAEVLQRDEELEHASKRSTAETPQDDLNDSSLRSSRRKKCSNFSITQGYLDALQRERQHSELSTKPRRAAKKDITYKEPSVKQKMRRT